MYNLILTDKPPGDTLTLKHGYSLLTDLGGRAVGSISRKRILDLNGREVAIYADTQYTVGEDGKKEKRRIYHSQLGEMYCREGVLYLQDEPIASTPKKERGPLGLIMLSVAALMLACVLALVLLIDLPYVNTPVIRVRDLNGSWDAQVTIAVLDKTIAPGTSGEYDFILDNPHNVKILYDFSIIELHNGEVVNNFPMEFRLRMNNVLLESEEWHDIRELCYTDITMLPNTKHSFTLEWRWLFDGGNDPLDTHFGELGGEYSLQFQMTAQILEE